MSLAGAAFCAIPAETEAAFPHLFSLASSGLIAAGPAVAP